MNYHQNLKINFEINKILKNYQIIIFINTNNVKRNILVI